MKKKLILSTVLSIFLLFFHALSDRELADDKKFTIFLNSKLLHLNDSVSVKNGSILLPLQAVMDAANAHVDYFEAQKKWNLYYNNSFAKLYLDQDLAYINGNEVKLTSPVTMIENCAYAPLSFYCEFLHLEPELEEDKIKLNSGFDTNYAYINSKLNREYKFEDFNLIIALPEGWYYIDDSYFGIDNPYEKYGFEIKTIDLNQAGNLDNYLDKIIGTVGLSSDYKVTDISKNKIITDNHDFYALYYTTEATENQDFVKESPTQREQGEEHIAEEATKTKEPLVKVASAQALHHAHYICQVGDTLYEFHFQHQKYIFRHPVLIQFENSLSSLKFAPYYMSPIYEHYIEYPSFSELEMELDSPIHSSIEVHDKLDFAGKLGKVNGNRLYAKVSRNKSSKVSEISMDENGRFDTTIYAPFGIGKHDVKIFKLSAEGREESIMQFNMINLSPKDIFYLVPGTYIRPDAANIKRDLKKILNRETFDEKFLNEYQIALSIFDYVSSRLFYDPELYFAGQAPNSADHLVLKNIRRQIDANVYLCSLMRGAEIPCRMMLGKNRSGEYLYLECMINGSWKVYDLNSQIQRKYDRSKSKLVLKHEDLYKKPDLLKLGKNSAPIEVFQKYYYVDSVYYQQLFDTVEYLDY